MTMIISPHTGFHGGGFRTVVGPITNTADFDRSSWTYVSKFLPGALKASGSKVRLTLQGLVSPGHVGTLSDVYIGLVATAAGSNAYDYDGNQVRVTFGGGNSVSLSTGSQHTSDEISFVIDRTKAILVAFNLASSTFISAAVNLGTNYVVYAKAAVNQAGDTSKDDTGYFVVGGGSVILSNLEII